MQPAQQEHGKLAGFSMQHLTAQSLQRLGLMIHDCMPMFEEANCHCSHGNTSLLAQQDLFAFHSVHCGLQHAGSPVSCHAIL